MDKRLCAIAGVYILLMLAAFFGIAGGIKKQEDGKVSDSARLSVTANEIKRSVEAGDKDEAVRLCDELTAGPDKDDKSSLIIMVPLMVSIVGVLTMLIYLNVKVIRPFSNLKDFAGEVSKGNFETPLEMSRENFFGDFTWAFDNMRHEISKSRAAEKEAIENNKTVIATLSHDIKTPIASIRTYSEAFEANMDSTPEKRQKYLSVLMDKCDEVTKLTNDLFLHSISEMNRLEVKNEQVELTSFIANDVAKLFVNEDDIKCNLTNKEITVNADPKRLLQVFENLKNNAEKYAKTNIEISLETGDGVKIHFRDFGPGIPDEDIPFITGKFYRGRNVGDEKGSGLGLYIVNELMNKMGGKVTMVNVKPGLDVVLELSTGHLHKKA